MSFTTFILSLSLSLSLWTSFFLYLSSSLSFPIFPLLFSSLNSCFSSFSTRSVAAKRGGMISSPFHCVSFFSFSFSVGIFFPSSLNPDLCKFFTFNFFPFYVFDEMSHWISIFSFMELNRRWQKFLYFFSLYWGELHWQKVMHLHF